jgi:Zn-dependent peptidase ImmA (M78 family)
VAKVPYISQDDMEVITENILVQYGFSVIVLDSSSKEVPVDEIIEFHFGLDIEWDTIDHFDSSGLVMAAIFPQKRKIVMNESCRDLFEEKIGTMHFTMAHELGHWVLHVDDKFHDQLSISIEDEEIYYCRSFSKKPPEEVQADMFAGCLLMPKPIIIQTINELKETTNKITFRHLYKIADMFKVTISALKVRLHSLNLLYIDDNGKIHNSREDSDGQLSF